MHGPDDEGVQGSLVLEIVVPVVVQQHRVAVPQHLGHRVGVHDTGQGRGVAGTAVENGALATDLGGIWTKWKIFILGSHKSLLVFYTSGGSERKGG